MLRSFRLGNHRSFRDEQELLLMPVYAKDREVLPVAAVYGANASGKSNLLDGLRFMADAVRDSFGQWRPGGGVPRRPFKLDPLAVEQPSVFVVEVVHDRVRYTYGFEVDDEKVISEWLYGYPEKRKRVFFERSGDQLRFGAAVARASAKLEVLVGLLRPNALFLSLAAQSNISALLPVYRWFTERLVFRFSVDAATEVENRVADFLFANPDSRERLVELLNAADLGISDLTVGAEPGMGVTETIRDAEKSTAKARSSLRLAEANLSEVESEIERVGSGDGLSARRRTARKQVEVAALDYRHAYEALQTALAAAEQVRRQVRVEHGTSGRPFRLEEESAGTLSWLSLLPTALEVLQRGGVLVVDEIDASLHSLLSARLVALFNDRDVNAADGQLIFTTHDATLLHPPLADEVLDRDEIWFVEKGRSGETVLYPLSDFKPRREDNLERRYLAGQYGAVPQVYGESFAGAVKGRADDEA